MASLIDFLVPKLYAQESDAISQPTFGEITAGTGSTTTSSVLLNWENPTVRVGDKFKVRVEVKTGDLKVSEYKIVITYNKDFLSVVDKDPSSPGTQITMLDTLLTVADPSTDNIASEGRISVTAAAASGTDYQVNKEVIEIEFQAQSIGTSKIQVATAVDGTRLTRLNGQPIAFNVNEVNVSIAQAIAQNPDPQPEPTTPTTPTQPTPTPVQETPVAVIPNTGISDNPSFMLSVALGIGFIFTGFSLVWGKFKKQK
ncbi:MAG: hypothetical protein IAE91_06415 [Ignavibacteriaceae bacterium]|nr:hypothetical protein [Ignavibacteriaceae bacterium]